MVEPRKKTWIPEKLIALGKQHGRAVLDSFSGRPFHKIPLKEFILQASGILSQRGEDAVGYEIGHYLITRRITEQLKDEEILEEKQEELFGSAVAGRLYHNPPLRLQKKQLQDFDKLIEMIGRKKAERLLIRTKELWQSFAEEKRREHEALGSRYPEETYEQRQRELKQWHKLGDMFDNPGHHIILSWLVGLNSQESVVDQFRKKLAEWTRKK